MKPWEVPTSTLGAGAIVLHRDHVLLVRVNYGPAKGQWIAPGGRVEKGEKPQDAVVREALEETGVAIELQGLISVRHRLFADGLANVYWVFLAKLKETTPGSGGANFPKLDWPKDEIIEARFWPTHEAIIAPEVRPMTRAAIRLALFPQPQVFQEARDYEGITPDDSVFAPLTR